MSGIKDDIRKKIGDEACWVQLAEEASELSQAAAKMARFLHGTNPVANPYDLDKRDLKVQLLTNVIEEYMDVVSVCEILEVPEHRGIIRMKRNRWVTRIDQNEEDPGTASNK